VTTIERFPDAVPEWGDPQVLLERPEREPERLGHRAGAEQRACRGSLLADRGDRPALQEDDPTAVIECPIDVLGSSEHRRHLARQVHETAPDVAGAQGCRDILPALADPAAG
jgi:hypothetical protein